MKKLLNRFISMVASLLLFFLSFSEHIVYANEYGIEPDSTISYTILAKTSSVCEEIAESYGGKLLEDTLNENNKDGGDESFIRANIVSCELTKQEFKEIKEQDSILAIEEDILFKGSELNGEELVYNQWNLDAINISNELFDGDVKVEVLDSGISYTEDIDVSQRINLIPDENELSTIYEDLSGHGTGISGLIAAKNNDIGITGVNPNAKIYSVKVLDNELMSPLSRILEGIYWGIENDMDIINMSFGTTVDSEILHTAIKDAKEAGILLIAASGNDKQKDIQYPAAYEEVIAVGSTNSSGEIADHTSVGTALELLAPGEQICTTGLFDGIIGTDGTSMAAAQVTGAASILIAKDNTRSADFIRMLLNYSAKRIQINENDNSGFIDIGYALEIYDEFAMEYDAGNIQFDYYNSQEIEDYSQEGEVIVEGLWGGGKHSESIENAGDEYNSNHPSSPISSTNIAKMATSASLMDSLFGNIEAIHGRGNYVANIATLWEMADELGKTSDKATAIANVRNRALSRYSNLTTTDKGILTSLIDYVDSILSTNMFSGSESDTVSRKYKILGAAVHMIGDTCAHRIMVPSGSINNFNSAYFKSGSNNQTTATLKEWLKDSIHEPYASKIQNNSNWGMFKAALSTGCMEFRDIKFFMNVDNRPSKYEDNANFYPTRFTLTINCIRRLLNAGSVSAARKIMIPTSSDNYMIFNNLKGYYSKSGGGISDVSYWSSISTDSFV